MDPDINKAKSFKVEKESLNIAGSAGKLSAVSFALVDMLEDLGFLYMF